MSASASAPTAQSLLDAILADPDNNDLRLIYADLLATKNEVHGELVHLSCRLAQLPEAEQPVLAVRIAELEARFLAELGGLARACRFVFDRGFIVGVSCHIAIATTRADELLRVAPLVERLDLTVDGQRDRVQLSRPHSGAVLARARTLAVRGLAAGNTRYGRGPIGDLGGLAVTPFSRLRVLDISRLRVAPDHITELLAPRTWPRSSRSASTRRCHRSSWRWSGRRSTSSVRRGPHSASSSVDRTDRQLVVTGSGARRSPARRSPRGPRARAARSGCW